ncbi:MAG TPA: malto-oligosyltrehalose trehalohydrolase [Gammaproteobacteria bacterium]|nr:malto-oligosyltrehalose trehalohydrolase [Gammaproteobacteria bacterium]
MKRAHAMPFGAEFAAGLGTRFRLWAPSAREVELVLVGASGERVLPMQREAGGWYARRLAEIGEGARYRYRIDGELDVPDPASRCNPQDVAGPSEVVDPRRYDWGDAAWRGRPWHEAVIYELHVGCYTAAGSFAGVEGELARLAALGVTAVELMPIADFPGRHNWGYDGVLPYAPDARYGRPEALKRLVDAAHRHGLMMLLDVVYNHFGPQGNYLHAYAADFFTDRHRTPWGSAIDFDGATRAAVREFFVHNALYWLEEYHFDGLRFDAVHAIHDDTRPSILDEIAARVRHHVDPARHVHLILENDDNRAELLDPAPARAARYDAQWNDDVHHCLHALVTGEREGYYADYVAPEDPHRAQCLLARALAEGYAYQGEVSAHRGGRRRGQPSAHLPATAFIAFLQNHDQIGNRAQGERLGALASEPALAAAVAVLLLAPQIPLLFMGEEWQAPEPFQFFCDFEAPLAALVREGRRREFTAFAAFDATAASDIPDPTDPATFLRSRLDRRHASAPAHAAWTAYYRRLLSIRRTEIVPRLPGARGLAHKLSEAGVLCVQWRLGDGTRLDLHANLNAAPASGPAPPAARTLFVTGARADADGRGGHYPPWFVAWGLADERV